MELKELQFECSLWEQLKDISQTHQQAFSAKTQSSEERVEGNESGSRREKERSEKYAVNN